MPPNELPRSNGALHAASTTILTIVAAGLAFGVYWQSRAAAGNGKNGPNLDDMEAIEASLAYKKPDAPKQPQKPKQAPEPEVKPIGVSHDENKKPLDEPVKKPDEPVKKPEDTDPLAKYRHKNDDDLETGKPEEPDTGAFDGSEFGFASETKGDPYFQALIADLVKGWEYPELLSDAGVPVGCLHLEPTGKISDTLFKTKSGNSELDDSVERALKNLTKLREDDPRPVPDHLLKQTQRWICFKFDARKQ